MRCEAEQLLGAQHRERVEHLGAEVVLAAFAARRRHDDVRRPRPCAKNAMSALFSSSGCAVVIIKVPAVSSLRSISSSEARRARVAIG